MRNQFNLELERFVEAQEGTYEDALEELKAGRKRSHWMWYVFPQLKVLGGSFNSQYYGISGLDEALAYLEHPLPSRRLRDVCNIILALPTDDPREVFGGIDSRKLRSSMTLFDLVAPDDEFAMVLEKYFGGMRDGRKLELGWRGVDGCGMGSCFA